MALMATWVLPAGAQAERPNIVVVMSDDQPYYSTSEMPYLSALPGLETFETLYNNNALCCPARATFLSGLYSHHTGVEINKDAEAFDPRETLAVWLDRVGYETALFGKYLNNYPFGLGTDYVPPGWDRWAAFVDHRGSKYYDYELSVDGVRRRFGSEPKDYSTDLLARRAHAFVSSAPEPFFALVAPYGPHKPYVAAPRHEGLYDNESMPLRPNFGEAARRAPTFYRRLPETPWAEQQTIWRDQMESLQSVDELSEKILSAADERGETIFLYLSDNGYSLGSHRVPEKRCGYEECGRAPGLIRSPGDPTELLASNADLAPTLADFAAAEQAPTDGRSLVPEMAGAPHEEDRAVLLRNRSSSGGRGFPRDVPSYWGLRTQRWKYLDHARKAGKPQEELYDLNADPFELENLATDAKHQAVVTEMRQRLALAREAPPSR